ncbi:hypothetical protein Tco_0323309 [Tanacetum coccineum]
MQRPPLFKANCFIYWKKCFETYVKSKDIDLWHIIVYGNYKPTIKNKDGKDEIIPYEKFKESQKKMISKNDEAKMVLHNALPKKEYERIFISKSDDEEYAIAVRDFKKFFRRRGKFVRQPHDDKKNFRKIKEDKKDKEDHSEEDSKKEEICLMALDNSEGFLVSVCIVCQSRMSNISDKGTTFGDGVARVGMQLRSSPKVSTSSPLVSPSTIINVPRELYSIDVAATFGVPLTTVGDLQKLINDIDAGKHDELLSELTNEDRMETLEALGSICNSIKVDRNNADVIPCKVSYADDSINLNVDESTIPSDPIVQSVDINKSTSYAGVAGGSAKDQPNVNSNFRTLVADPVFDGVNISIPRKVVEKTNKQKVVSPPIVATSNVVTPNAEKTNDGFQTVGKKKKRKGKSKSTNGGQFTSHLVKHNVRYEPKATTSAPMKGTTYVGYTSQSTLMLKTIDNSSKKDNLSMYNSFSALNEEEVENVYDDSANLIHNTKAGGSSSFTAAAG